MRERWTTTYLLSARQTLVCLVVLLVPGLFLPASRTAAGVPEVAPFEQEWLRIDHPVSVGDANRSWTWGPEPIVDDLSEWFASSDQTVEMKTVRYFDKARMQATAVSAEPASQSTVEAGDVVRQLMTGVLQGDGNQIHTFPPSLTPVAGDIDDSNGVSYSTLALILDEEAVNEGEVLTTAISADGSLSDNANLATYEITAEDYVADTDHRIASVFLTFLNADGLVQVDDRLELSPLYPEPLSVTGYPLMEPYWLDTKVTGSQKYVLVQCFERRCLTYTPDNPAEWQVEWSNVGSHYYEWRYHQISIDDPEPPIEPDALPEAQFVNKSGANYTLRLEVSASFATRACGLMHRDELARDLGMLFVWESDQLGSFWNCNTFVPLTLAWLDAEGIILGFSEMQAQVRGEPQNVLSYPAPEQYRYVIEANQGWFAARGIQVGDRALLDQALARGDTRSNSLCDELGLDCG